MTNTRIILLGIFLAILLAILVLWCADVLAGTILHRHGDGDEWEWHLHGQSADDYLRMHESCGLTYEMMEWVEFETGKTSDCLKLARRLTVLSGRIPSLPHSAQKVDYTPPVQEKPKPIVRQVTAPVKSVIPSEVSGTISPSAPITEEEIALEPECESTRLQHFIWEETMLGLRLLPEGVDTVGGVWEALGLSVAKGNELYFYRGGWVKYIADDPMFSGSIITPVLPNTGFVVTQTKRDLITFEGCPLDNADRIELQAGPNLIGFPKKPDAFDRPSDFLSDKVLWVTVQINGVYHEISQAGDTGDVPLKAGQAIIIESSEYHWVTLSAPAAPSAQRHGTLATSWCAVKLGSK